MFKSIDIANFGQHIKSLRNYLGYTQNDVHKYTLINVDTLRKIEGGLVVPRYETLAILSSLYKVNLTESFCHFTKEQDLYIYYDQIDDAILRHDIGLIDAVKAKLSDALIREKICSNLIIKSDFEQFELYIHALADYFKGNYINLNNLIKQLTTALKISNPDFNAYKIKVQHFNFLELRILLLYALCQAELQHYKLSNKILLHLLDVTNLVYFNHQVKLKIDTLIYFNLSYNYHNTDDFKRSLKYAKQGIDICLAHNSIRELPQLFYRCFTAEYHLGIDTAVESYYKCIHLLEIMDKTELKTLYIDITQQKYPDFIATLNQNL